MKLVRQLTISLLLAIGLVLAVDTVISVRSHLALFEKDMRSDEIAIGEVIRRSVESTWRLSGESAARAFVEDLSRQHDEIRIRFVAWDRSATGREAVQGRDDPGDGARVRTLLPLAVNSSEPLALEVSEPLLHERTYLAQRVRGSLLTSLATVLACGLIAWAVGIRIVGRPIQALVAKARRIGAGDFDSPLRLSGHHELSLLAVELNDMAASLDAAARKVAAESAARISALEQLRHADRLTTVGKLASGLAHELGTPLNVVAGRAAMISQREIDDPAEIEESARIIADQSERMARIVRQLLDFARRQPPEKRSADLPQLARRTVELLESIAKKRGVEIELESEQPELVALVDPSQIQQVLTNVFVNALQASRSGQRVSVRIRQTSPNPPDSAERARGRHAVIEVVDCGAGIPEEQQAAIFDPFFTTKSVGEGTGLGLSVAFGIVKEHGGWIEVESQPGAGSCFRIWLPLEAA